VETGLIQPIDSSISPDHVATIIYTSGTTGKPKGVELTHSNIVADIQGMKYTIKAELGRKVSLAFLPWAHVFGQVSELHSFVSSGSSLAIVPSRDQILECIQIIKPSCLFSVPIMLNRVSTFNSVLLY
jgi:long-chain acyl-CoA synthetase